MRLDSADTVRAFSCQSAATGLGRLIAVLLMSTVFNQLFYQAQSFLGPLQVP